MVSGKTVTDTRTCGKSVLERYEAATHCYHRFVNYLIYSLYVLINESCNLLCSSVIRVFLYTNIAIVAVVYPSQAINMYLYEIYNILA